MNSSLRASGESSATELLLRVNGVQAAFGTEFGLDSPRNNELRRRSPYRQANVSYSLMQRCAGRVVRHTLIDIGMGVLPSLLELEQSHGVHVVHELLLTHHHFDHFVGLDWLCACIRRSDRPDQPRPLQVYASGPTFSHGPGKTFPHLAGQIEHVLIEAGQSLTFGAVVVTPLAVEHSQKVPGAMGYVIQFGDRKIIISGDFRKIADEDSPELFDADVCFLDANTWHPTPDGNHSCVLEDLRLVQKWRPRRTYLIHYSGHEDCDRTDGTPQTPLAMGQFRAELDRVRGAFDIQPAIHGMVLGDDVPFP